MDNLMSKEKILKKIRKALLEKTEMPYPDQPMDVPLFKGSDEPLEVQFAKELKKVDGEFIYCEHLTEFIQNLEALQTEKNWTKVHCYDPLLLDVFASAGYKNFSNSQDISNAEVGITRCEALVARTGSVLLSSEQSSGHRLSIWPPVHVVVATPNQVLPDISDAMRLMKEKYGDDIPSMLSLTSGPSRSLGLKEATELGSSGPKEVYVFLVEM